MLNLQSIYFGQKHKDFDYEDFIVIKAISGLAKKHQRQCENDCNGTGWVKNVYYYNGNIDDWARREYGQGVKSAYIDNTEETIFYKEIARIEARIKSIIEKWDCHPIVKSYKVEFQHDPRGNTVKLYYEGDFIEL
jgi:hypothetical protein